MNFQDLEKINVNNKVEKKKVGSTTLTYLSWTYAISEFKKAYPDFTYEVKKFDNGSGVLVPYMYDENTGYMVMTSITAGGLTQEMWLPVMDNSNKAMKNAPYEYEVKEYVNGKATGQMIKKFVEPATMFDVNKTIMRCLVKNMAMFGLGLYIYAGEDLPASDDDNKDKQLETLPEELIKAVQETKTLDELSVLYNANKDDMSKELKQQFNSIVSNRKQELSK